MKIGVQVIDDQGTYALREYHEGDEVTADSEDGELNVTIRDAAGSLVHWVRYAQGQWIKVWLEEGMSGEVLASRATRQVYAATTGLTAVPGVAGNSGPGY